MKELDGLIGQRIAEARLAAGLTQEQLAEMAGIAAENLSRAERGRTILRTRKLIAIADSLGVSLDDLARGREVTPREGVAVTRLVKRVAALDESTARAVGKVVSVFLEALRKERCAHGLERSLVLAPDLEHEDDVEDLAIDVAATVVSDAGAEPALEVLFGRRPGQWVDAATLCRDLEPLDEDLAALHDEGVSVQVTWLDTPNRVGDPAHGYCVVVFYSPELNWIVNIAVFDKKHFDEQRRR